MLSYSLPNRTAGYTENRAARDGNTVKADSTDLVIGAYITDLKRTDQTGSVR
ncbi:hypothetical protein DPMN_177016 [Dreissena polymorpha]|uniref:Uncharacterized protein n=1 Tax=Dreissena polymorpha TaxID=45954 RepID=A0A9D4IL72_DREPO|nr:hypothetical protein DPMN_177014 [Dreissena polymorpha]KAH3775610.1 hypothetical protein DPMN_177016 [Dreissena polymorpha]